MKIKCNITLPVLLLLFTLCCFTGIKAQRFTIPVIPDSQEAITRDRGLFFRQMEWLAQKKDSLRAPIVLHVGDLVNFDSFDQWETASVGMKILDRARLPYAIAPGNHDTEAVGIESGSAAPGDVKVNLRKTAKFNYFFPAQRFSLQAERFEPDKSDNACYLFEAGGLKWMVITLEFCAREGAAQWMDQTLKSYPDRNAIVLTHYHLTSGGEIATTNAGYGAMRVSDIFERYIRPHENVLLVLSGHVCFSASRTDKGTEGNTIYQLLQNYQCKSNGAGLLRMLDIDVAEKTITARMFSPYTHEAPAGDAAVIYRDVHFIDPAL